MVSGSTANINPCNYSNCDFFACQGADKVSNDSTRILGGNKICTAKAVTCEMIFFWESFTQTKTL